MADELSVTDTMFENDERNNPTTNDRLNTMQKQIDSMQYQIVELNNALRSKSAMITKLSAELETLKQRIDIHQNKQHNEITEYETKEQIDTLPIPDLTVKNIYKCDNAQKHLLLWSGSTPYKNEKYNKIQLLNLNKYIETNGQQKPYSFELQSIQKTSLFNKKNIQFSSHFDRYWFGNDIITNCNNIPKYIHQYIHKLNSNLLNKLTSNVTALQQKWNLNKTSTTDTKQKLLFDSSTNHSMIFRCGGVYANNKQRCSECDVTIFNHLHDKQIIKGYTLNLPSLPLSISLSSCIYNHFNGILYCVCGDTDSDDVTSNIYALNLDPKDDMIPSWNKSEITLFEKRKCVSLCLIDQHNLMVIGGKSKCGEQLNSVELFVNTTNRYKTTKLLSPLCLPRSMSGSLLFNKSEQRVIVGGGWGGFNNDGTKRSVEWYDAMKNKWYLFPNKTNYEHQFCPVLWNNPNQNENVIYIGGDCVGIDSKSMLGMIEWIDIRESENNKSWNVFKNKKSLVEMFSLQNIDEKMWRSRALFIS